MKIAPIADVKARFSAYLEEARSHVVIVTKNGRPEALLVSVSHEDDLESLILAHSPKFRRLIARAEAQIARGEGLTAEAVWGKPKPAKRRKRKA